LSKFTISLHSKECVVGLPCPVSGRCLFLHVPRQRIPICIINQPIIIIKHDRSSIQWVNDDEVDGAVFVVWPNNYGNEPVFGRTLLNYHPLILPIMATTYHFDHVRFMRWPAIVKTLIRASSASNAPFLLFFTILRSSSDCCLLFSSLLWLLALLCLTSAHCFCCQGGTEMNSTPTIKKTPWLLCRNPPIRPAP
jgi:hypothetical protein